MVFKYSSSAIIAYIVFVSSVIDSSFQFCLNRMLMVQIDNFRERWVFKTVYCYTKYMDKVVSLIRFLCHFTCCKVFILFAAGANLNGEHF